MTQRDESASRRDEALRLLRAVADGSYEPLPDEWYSPPPSEGAHMIADEILLDLIGDPEIREAFESIEKWYA